LTRLWHRVNDQPMIERPGTAPRMPRDQPAPGDVCRPKVAFVVQRYGTEVVGGAELMCRDYAESLADRYDVEVLTSCALDYTTWSHHYPAGVSELHGVAVRRFAATGLRHTDLNRWWTIWQHRPRTRGDETRWLFEQGPVLPGLLQHLAAHRDDYVAVIFFTYLYWPTVLGLPLVADKAVLVPTANPGDGPLHFTLHGELFHLPRALIYCTDEERDFCHTLFRNASVPHEVLGAGFEPVISDDPGRFSRALGLERPYVLCLGRIGPAKGCDRLVRDYLAIPPDRTPVDLVFAGTLEMELPQDPRIRHAGTINGSLKHDAICGAAAMVVPSPWDCLSLTTCEAWAAGRPVLITAQSPVVTSLCRRSGGGVAYANPHELEALLTRLVADPAWGDGVGEQGRAFVLGEYGKTSVHQRLEALIDRVGRDEPAVQASTDARWRRAAGRLTRRFRNAVGRMRSGAE
jgi:glycosyltransferase involved in cell wall biosynthesis